MMETVALKLFRKSDREGKGFIVKRDMQRMKDDIPLPPEQLEIVFDTLDEEKKGYITLDQFLNGFRQHSVLSAGARRNSNDFPFIKLDFNEELNSTLSLIKETNLLKTSADDLAYISEQMKDGTGCQLSQWEIFLRDLNQDLQTYKIAHLRLEKILKEKEHDHKNYVKKLYEEIDIQLREEQEKDLANEQIQRKLKDEMNTLKAEIVAKDKVLQQLNAECKELKKQLLVFQKKERETNIMNATLLNQQNYYESELEAEREKRYNIQSILDNIRRRFSIEKSQCFKEGFDLARKVISVQEEGLLQQLHILHDIQNVLSTDENENIVNS